MYSLRFHGTFLLISQCKVLNWDKSKEFSALILIPEVDGSASEISGISRDFLCEHCDHL
jgi:hypothetical protein